MTSSGQCRSCAYFQASESWCLEWEVGTRPDKSCARYIPADGQPPSSKPAPSGPDDARNGRATAPYRHQIREMVLALRANGLPATVIAERLGVTRQLVNYHLRKAKQQAKATVGDALLLVPTPIGARELIHLLEAACQAWGDVSVELSTQALRVVKPRTVTGNGAENVA